MQLVKELSEGMPLVNFFLIVAMPFIIWIVLVKFWAAADSRYVSKIECSFREQGMSQASQHYEADIVELHALTKENTERLVEIVQRLTRVETLILNGKKEKT